MGLLSKFDNCDEDDYHDYDGDDDDSNGHDDNNVDVNEKHDYIFCYFILLARINLHPRSSKFELLSYI